MALRGSGIKNFDDLWCLVALGGLEFCVSSISFQKSNIGWPQQPPTEMVPYISESSVLMPLLLKPSGSGSFLRK